MITIFASLSPMPIYGLLLEDCLIDPLKSSWLLHSRGHFWGKDALYLLSERSETFQNELAWIVSLVFPSKNKSLSSAFETRSLSWYPHSIFAKLELVTHAKWIYLFQEVRNLVNACSQMTTTRMKTKSWAHPRYIQSSMCFSSSSSNVL